MRQQRSGFTPQVLSNLLLGMAHLRSAAQPGTYRLAAAVEALAAECHVGRGFQGFTHQQLSSAAWALAKLGYDRQAWYAVCVKAALRPGSYTQAPSQDWSSLWLALAEARHRTSDAPLPLARTAEAMGALRGQANGQECADMLWALATLGLYDRRLVGCMLGRLVELRGHGDTMEQGLARCGRHRSWALQRCLPTTAARWGCCCERLLGDGGTRKGVPPFQGRISPSCGRPRWSWRRTLPPRCGPWPPYCGRQQEAALGCRRPCSRWLASVACLTTPQPGACAVNCWPCCR